MDLEQLTVERILDRVCRALQRSFSCAARGILATRDKNRSPGAENGQDQDCARDNSQLEAVPDHRTPSNEERKFTRT
ncbi:hypothetical protein [Xanthobacter pseudotagetidis]|uniref:hypothetical protein n=1 Tax=Xanthobacter pseudotagetidis TaxID=3119911 RepID=UPI00372CD10B